MIHLSAYSRIQRIYIEQILYINKMANLTIRGLSGPHVIEVENSNLDRIVTLQSSPTIDLPEGTHELAIYICKGRQYNANTKKDIYLKGKIHTKVAVIIPDEQTIYI